MALFDLLNMKQRSESMISFGARLKLALNSIDATMRKELKLYFFQNHVRDDVAKKVSRHMPSSLDQAIQYAIYLERTDKTAMAQNRSKTRFFNAPTLTTPPVFNQLTDSTPKDSADTATPMEDIQTNIQSKRKKHFNSQQATTQKFKGKCHHCKKTRYKIKDCWKRKNKESNQQTITTTTMSPSSAQQSSQQTISSIDTNDNDLTSSVFDYLDKNNQTILQYDTDIPSRQSVQADDAHRSSLRFNVKIELGRISVWALIDTGSEITSMDEETLLEAQLQAAPAQPLFIQYGDKTKSLSNKEVTTTLTMNNQQYKVMIRSVPKQNTKVILGMDWLVGLDVYLDPDIHTIIPKRQFFTMDEIQYYKHYFTYNSRSSSRKSVTKSIFI
ncbi:hypothetical protein BDC45DRAFT_591235 [Circinella umbellata]|nr:hypothetical protein BDC45DRAFT_591235 [Circinella umbellata]